VDSKRNRINMANEMRGPPLLITGWREVADAALS
jgi:hypothetical protein